jgi:uncharacterized protein
VPDASLPIADALFAKTRQAVLALLFGHPDRAYYTREIIAAANAGSSQVQSELERLTRAGLVLREPRGNQVHYRANRDAPVFPELAGLVTKTFGVADVLRAALAPLAPSIELALLYGSIATGEARASSDVDLLVVSKLLLADLEGALDDAERRLARRISITLLDPAEFRERLRARDHFVTAVLRARPIALIGDPPNLAKRRERSAR